MRPSCLCRESAAKNHKTLWKEAEKLIGTKTVQELHDPLDVIETIMRYFYSLAQAMRKTPDAELSQIVSMYERAGKLAALAAPYRHGRLSAIKLLGDPNAATGGFKPDATLEEVREEIGRRVLAMAQAGLIDIDPAALPQPEPKVAN